MARTGGMGEGEEGRGGGGILFGHDLNEPGVWVGRYMTPRRQKKKRNHLASEMEPGSFS